MPQLILWEFVAVFGKKPDGHFFDLFREAAMIDKMGGLLSILSRVGYD